MRIRKEIRHAYSDWRGRGIVIFPVRNEEYCVKQRESPASELIDCEEGGVRDRNERST